MPKRVGRRLSSLGPSRPHWMCGIGATTSADFCLAHHGLHRGSGKPHSLERGRSPRIKPRSVVAQVSAYRRVRRLPSHPWSPQSSCPHLVLLQIGVVTWFVDLLQAPNLAQGTSTPYNHAPYGRTPRVGADSPENRSVWFADGREPLIAIVSPQCPACGGDIRLRGDGWQEPLAPAGLRVWVY